MLDFILNKTTIKTIVSLLFLFFIYFAVTNIFDKLLNFKTKGSKIDIKKINTIKSLFKNIFKYILIFIGIIIILGSFGIKTTSLVASLGVVGVVVGLALQDILKDFFSGIFIIIENQFELGDTIEIGGFKGEVISLGLKTTRIKKYTGEIKIITNRNIEEVINYSKASSLAIIDIGVSYSTDIEKVEKILNNLCCRLNNEYESSKIKIESVGIENLADSAVIFRIIATAKPMEHFGLRREILKQVKLEFDKNKINIPYPQIEVHNGSKI